MGKLQAKILEIIQTSGTWITRAKIASGLNRKTGVLSTYDIKLLDDLVSTGKVKKRSVIKGAVQEVYEYKAK